jgi:predicted methyltransferase
MSVRHSLGPDFTRRHLLSLAAGFGAGAALAVPACAGEDRLRALVDGPQRAASNRARDPYRHPYETLAFLGMREDATVVEILPGGSGYWTEILAPYLRDHGLYIAANAPKDTDSGEMQRENAAFLAKMQAAPQLYDKVQVSEFKADRHVIAPAGTADFVLTFRNVHNWMAAGETDAAFATFFKALKPGGILGIEEHRASADQPQDPLAKSGYVRQDVTIGFAQKAGFRLAASSEINANPKDTKDYPAGVWTLPPAYRLKDQDRARYTEIGESDRFLLKFEKPRA